MRQFEQNIASREDAARYEQLSNMFTSFGKVCIAFSGGVDSSVLLAVAKQTLGVENVIAVTAKGIMTSEDAYSNALATANEIGVDCYTVEEDAFTVPEFVSNDRKRCYHCKKGIFENMLAIAREKGFTTMVEGSNLDDESKYRPGKVAIKELGVRSPLAECGYTKKLIRNLAKQLHLSVWSRPSDSCLATRFPYDTLLTKEMFEQVGKAEALIKSSGIRICRVRIHGDIARIEVQEEDMPTLIGLPDIYGQLKELGLKYITLDLGGFRSGSMDE
ncbi:MAG TPA: ATP-dependent sacrificial sulfur transferase LarE [Lachnospiraceae bacterium]|nr:ATP-dependent sacrificial sulfur transferase LarE [Lachnospiraceae bacterium]